MNATKKSITPFQISFLLILALGSMLRFYSLWEKSFWIDEVFSINTAKDPLTAIIAGSSRREFFDFEQQPQHLPSPVHFIYLHLALQFGNDETVLRFIPCLFGIMTMFLLFLLGRELFGKEVGLLAMTLLSFSSFHINFSQDLRYYSYFLFFSVLSFFFLLRYFRTAKKIHLFCFLMYSLATIFTHYLGIIVYCAQVFIFGLCYFIGNSKTRWTVSFVLISLLIAIFLIFPVNEVQYDHIVESGGSSFPQFRGILRVVADRISNEPQANRYSLFFLTERLKTLLNGDIAFLYVLFIIVGIIAGMKKRPVFTSQLMILSLLMYTPIIYLKFPRIADRYLIYLLPPLLLMCSAGIVHLSQLLSRKIPRTQMLFGVMAIFFFASLPRLGDYYTEQYSFVPWRGDWRGATHYLAQHMQENDSFFTDDVTISAYAYLIPDNHIEYRYFGLAKEISTLWFADWKYTFSEIFQEPLIAYNEKAFHGVQYTNLYPKDPSENQTYRSDLPILLYKVCSIKNRTTLYNASENPTAQKDHYEFDLGPLEYYEQIILLPRYVMEHPNEKVTLSLAGDGSDPRMIAEFFSRPLLQSEIEKGGIDITHLVNSSQKNILALDFQSTQGRHGLMSLELIDCHRTVPQNRIELTNNFSETFTDAGYLWESHSLHMIDYHVRYHCLQPRPDTVSSILYHFSVPDTVSNLTLVSSFRFEGQNNFVRIKAGNSSTRLQEIYFANVTSKSRDLYPKLTISDPPADLFVQFEMFLNRSTNAAPFSVCLKGFTVLLT